jgi:hypothetical protein
VIHIVTTGLWRVKLKICEQRSSRYLIRDMIRAFGRIGWGKSQEYSIELVLCPRSELANSQIQRLVTKVIWFKEKSVFASPCQKFRYLFKFIEYGELTSRKIEVTNMEQRYLHWASYSAAVNIEVNAEVKISTRLCCSCIYAKEGSHTPRRSSGRGSSELGHCIVVTEQIRAPAILTPQAYTSIPVGWSP